MRGLWLPLLAVLLVISLCIGLSILPDGPYKNKNLQTDDDPILQYNPTTGLIDIL